MDLYLGQDILECVCIFNPQFSKYDRPDVYFCLLQKVNTAFFFFFHLARSSPTGINFHGRTDWCVRETLFNMVSFYRFHKNENNCFCTVYMKYLFPRLENLPFFCSLFQIHIRVYFICHQVWHVFSIKKEKKKVDVKDKIDEIQEETGENQNESSFTICSRLEFLMDFCIELGCGRLVWREKFCTSFLFPHFFKVGYIAWEQKV